MVVGAGGAQTSEVGQGWPLDEDAAAEVVEDEVVLDEVWPPAPPVPSRGSGPGHPATAADTQAKTATASPLRRARSPRRREPFDCWFIWTSTLSL